MPYDPEIAGIFAEEAAELLEAADGAVARISEAGGGDGAAQAMADLQRYLHTLKGGARMAGLSVMGDFSHELETLLIRVSEGLIPRSAAINELLQASLDELHRLREDVMTGEQRPLTPQLADRLRAALRVGGAPAPRRIATRGARPAAEPSIAADARETSTPSREPARGWTASRQIEPLPAPEVELPVVAEAPDISLPALDRLGELARELEQPAPAPRFDAAAGPCRQRRRGPRRRSAARRRASIPCCSTSCSTMRVRSASSSRA